MKDAHRYAKECDISQRMGQPHESNKMPHQPVLPLEPAQKWRLDFAGPFKLATTQTRNKYVSITMDYGMKWVEAKALRRNTAKFLYECIWCRYNYPIDLISDQGSHYINEVVKSLVEHYTIVHKMP